MAKGSERFAFVQYADAPRVCASCGRRLRVGDVAKVHTRYESGRATSRFYCREHMHTEYGA